MSKEQPCRLPWMTDDQYKCVEMAAELFNGFHHLPKIKQQGSGIAISTCSSYFATYDFNRLTMLVFLAHEKCIRASIEHARPGSIKICLYKRQREGRMSERHPTLETAIARFKGE